MVEYAALILGLKVLKELGAKRIATHEDSELIINQVKGIYQSKHPRLRAYKNLALDLLKEFSKVTILFGKFLWSLIRTRPLSLQVYINVYGRRYVLLGYQMVEIHQLLVVSPWLSPDLQKATK
jgi:hypothetical protein